MSVKIKIKSLYGDTILPTKAHPEDACWDVFAHEIIQKEPDLWVVKLGFATQIPLGYKGVIVPRSSFTGFQWVQNNSPAQMDASFIGEWQIRYRAIPIGYIKETRTNVLVSSPNERDRHMVNYKRGLRYPEFPFTVGGDAVAQIYFEKILDFEWEPTDTLEDTTRGTGGFGSTNKNK